MKQVSKTVLSHRKYCHYLVKLLVKLFVSVVFKQKKNTLLKNRIAQQNTFLMTITHYEEL